MKNLLTLSAIAAMSAASLGAQAQFTVDGMLSANEVGTGAGKYQLLGTYTGTHSVADRGLKSIYVGNTATTLNIMVVASPERGSGSYNALLLYLDAPNATGVAAGTRLAGGDDNSSQFRHRPTLDMPVDYGFRLTASPLAGSDANVYHSKIDYTAAPNAAGKYKDTYLGPSGKTGVGFTVTDATSNVVGAKVSYKTTTSGSVASNTDSGWEIEYPLSVLGGAAAGDVFHLMAAYVADNGDFYSDVLPQITGQTTDLGTDPNFTTFAGNQYLTYTLAQGLSTRTASPALQASAYPNPVSAASRLSYLVPSGTQPVAVDVYNTMGQKALTLLNTTQSAGAQALSLQPLQQLAAGTYLVTLRVGQELSTHRVVVE
jgi:hypothetical protein